MKHNSLVISSFGFLIRSKWIKNSLKTDHNSLFSICDSRIDLLIRGYDECKSSVLILFRAFYELGFVLFGLAATILVCLACGNKEFKV